MLTKALLISLATLAPLALPAQAKPATKPATRAATVVKRKGTPEEIAAARDAALVALRGQWAGGFQGAEVGANACELKLFTKKTVGDLVTDDLQTVDVGRLGTDMERVRDPLAGTDDLRMGTASGEAEIVRTRRRVLEGAPQKATTEKVLFLAILAARGSGKADDGAAALLAWSIPCERP